MTTDEKLQEDIAIYVEVFVTERFDGLSTDLDKIMREVAFDAFLGGVKYGEEYKRENTKSKIITKV